jgi:hypothetical protein
MALGLAFGLSAGMTAAPVMAETKPCAQNSQQKNGACGSTADQKTQKPTTNDSTKKAEPAKATPQTQTSKEQPKASVQNERKTEARTDAKPTASNQQTASSKRHAVGDRIDSGYEVVKDPTRYGLDKKNTYYSVNNEIFRVDSDTHKVLAILGAASALLK